MSGQGDHMNMVCGNCRLWRRTRRHGSRGGSRLACGAEVDEAQRRQIERGKRYFTDFSRGYGPGHGCHRPDDFERRDV